MKLYSSSTLGSLDLQNHLVMCPLTRNRAIGNVPNDLMATYYGQRSSVGLIITEGVSPSPNGLGYPRIPGVYSQEQTDAWKKVAKAAHQGGAKIFMQLMHTGRISHALNMPKGAKILAPSAIPAAGEIWTDQSGMQPHPVPNAMSETEILATIEEYAQAARNAVAAGFDGIELHAANGYLIEQFIRPTTNHRTDSWGGDIDGRSRFALAVADAAVAAIGAGRVGIRLSPYGVFNDMPPYPEMETDYLYLAKELSQRGLLYVHLVDHSPMGAPEVPDSIKQGIRDRFHGALILSGGYDAGRAEDDLVSGRADLIAVGRPVLANPDLVARWHAGAQLNEPDMNTFYTSGEQGYTDYPFM